MAAYDFEPEMPVHGTANLVAAPRGPIGTPVTPSPAALISNMAGELAEMAVNVERLRDQHRQLSHVLKEAEARFAGLQREVTTACEQIVNGGDKIKQANY